MGGAGAAHGAAAPVLTDVGRGAIDAGGAAYGAAAPVVGDVGSGIATGASAAYGHAAPIVGDIGAGATSTFSQVTSVVSGSNIMSGIGDAMDNLGGVASSIADAFF